MENKRPAWAASGGIIAVALAVVLLCNYFGSWPARSLAGETNMANAVPAQQDTADISPLEDPLLVLVNKEHPLEETWEWLPFLVDDEIVDRRMAADLSAMLQAAEADNVWLWVASGYRSAAYQEKVLENAILENQAIGMTESQAREDALRTIAQPGHSEHQTGLAIDFNDVTPAFQETEAYRWLEQHSPEYGFVQRYPAGKEDITGFSQEAWHYRYVGKNHAQAMKRLGMCLEEYLLYLQDLEES